MHVYHESEREREKQKYCNIEMIKEGIENESNTYAPSSSPTPCTHTQKHNSF